MSDTAQTPPPLTQDPEAPILKPLVIPQKSEGGSFDATKVLAAIGLILTITIIIVGIMWMTIINLESRVNTLEGDVKVTDVTPKTSATEAAAKIASVTATKSAN